MYQLIVTVKLTFTAESSSTMLGKWAKKILKNKRTSMMKSIQSISNYLAQAQVVTWTDSSAKTKCKRKCTKKKKKKKKGKKDQCLQVCIKKKRRAKFRRCKKRCTNKGKLCVKICFNSN